MILFLTVAQVAISVYSRESYNATTQGAVAFAAMGSTSPQAGMGSGTLSALQWASPPIALPLPGGGSILVGQRQIESSSVTPLLPSGEKFTTTGIAVQE